MSEAKTISASVTENGNGAFGVDIDVSGHRLSGDEPQDFGGQNLGPAPYDLLTAALGECTAMTVRWYAIQQKWPLERAEAVLTHHKEGRTDHFTKTITLHGPDLTPEQREKLIDVAKKCPVQRTLEGTPVITTAAL